MRGWVLNFVLRFALLYAVLLVGAAHSPLYVWIEHGIVSLVDSTLPGDAHTVRTLGIDARDGAPRYRYEVERSGIRRDLGGPVHLHGFVPLLTLALVLATPGLARARRAWLPAALALATSVVLAAGMLMSDLDAYERAAFPGESGPYGAALAWFDGLHRTAGAGLLPLVLWSFAAFSALNVRELPGRDAPAGSQS